MDREDLKIINLQGDVNRLNYIVDELRKDNYKKFERINELEKKFSHLEHCENHYTNRWYYLAFVIIYDTEFFGIYSNYSNYDSTLDNVPVLKLRDFLCENSINTLSDVLERKDEIVGFLYKLVNQEEE